MTFRSSDGFSAAFSPATLVLIAVSQVKSELNTLLVAEVNLGARSETCLA